MRKICIIKLGTTFDAIRERFGDFDQWTGRALGVPESQIMVVDAENGQRLPNPEDCAAVVVTGSHAMVTDDLPWSLEVENWIPGLLRTGTPFLGICYGHQLLARAAGGRVGYHPKGREIGTIPICMLSAHKKDPLFWALPKRFSAHAIHSQSVIRIPPDAVHLATSAEEVYHSFRVGECAWGIQFHPEFTPAILAAYITEIAEELTEEGRSVEALLGGLSETPAALEVVRRFAAMVRRAEPDGEDERNHVS
jgi:GMP synthase (glutamine-hydrolysing)